MDTEVFLHRGGFLVLLSLFMFRLYHMACGLRSLTRDGTCAPCSGSIES